MSRFLPAHRDLSALKRRLQDSADRREGYRPLPSDEPRTPPPGTSGVPPKLGEAAASSLRRALAERGTPGPWLEGWAHSRLLDVGAVRLQYRERSDGDVDIRQLRQPYDASEVWRLEWTQARACSYSLWCAEGWATTTSLGEAREAKARAYQGTVAPHVERGVSGVPTRPFLAERIESALAIPKTVFHQVAPANEADASRDEHADIDQLAVPAERQPAPTGPIHKLFGYLFRTWLRRWVARLEWH